MGYPMAGHLKAGGHDVTVYNRTAAKADKWVAEYEGAKADTPADTANGCDFVFACVGDDKDIASVTTGPDGAFNTMRADAVFIDNTTASADIARVLMMMLVLGACILLMHLFRWSGRCRRWQADRNVRR